MSWSEESKLALLTGLALTGVVGKLSSAGAVGLEALHVTIRAGRLRVAKLLKWKLKESVPKEPSGNFKDFYNLILEIPSAIFSRSNNLKRPAQLKRRRFRLYFSMEE